MAGKELTFKLVMNADTKNFTQNLQQSSDAAKAMFDQIRQESERARQSVQMGREVGELVQQFHNATTELNRVSDASQLSADNLRQMGEYGQQAISQLQDKLVDARLELNRLSATNSTPQDIERARQRVQELETGIRQTTTAVGAYQNAAREALGTSPIPTRFQQDVGNLVNQLDSVRQGIDANGDSATRTRAELEQMSRNATTQLQGYESALDDARLNLNRLSATNATPQDIERARQRVQELETGVDQVRTALNGYQNAARIANNEVAEGSGRVSSAVNGVGGAWNKVAGIAAALGIGISVAELAKIADNFQNISAQIRLVSDSSEEFHSALEGVRVIATQTTTSLESTANLYARISQAGKDLGVTQEQALEVTRAINQSIQISGGSAASADAAITQLIQGLQSGVLRGEEFNSMMEQAPRLTTALADSLGVTKGELRAMAAEGELTSEIVINALKEQSAVIAEEYTKIPTTISGAFTNLKTNFTMLVGEVDSANAASQGIVQTLLYLSENLDVLTTLFNDATQGVAYFSDRLNSADPSTIDAVKNAVVTAYDAIKTLISTVVDVGDVINDVFFTGLDVLFGWSGVVSGDATESVNGLAVVINIVSVAIGALADGVSVIGIGFKGLVGLMYDLAAAATYYAKVFTWGDVRAKLDADYELLKAQRDKYYAEAEKDINEFQSKTQKAIDESTLNAEQANQKKIASNKETLATILADEAKANEDAEANSKRRTELDAQLAKARAEGNKAAATQAVNDIKKLEEAEDASAKSSEKRNKDKLNAVQTYAEAAIAANKGVMDGVMQADLLTKGYIVTIDQAGKVSVQAGESAAQAADNAKAKEEALKLAKDNVKKADEEYLAYQKQAAVERAILEKQIEEAKRTGDLNALSSAQSSISAINAKEAELTNNRDVRIAELNKATSGSGQVAESAYSRASAAANQFGVDLDVSLNKVSKSFTASGTQLTELKGKLNEAGVTGQNAATVLYQSWESWLNKAKSQAEIDAANSKMREFEAQGVFSTKQVELGIMAIRKANAALPDELDETGKAFDRLGIKTKEQLKLTAQQAVMDYNTIKNSGQATAEGIQQAGEKAAQAVALSGDASVTAQFNAIGATQKLRVEIDETGKASVKSMDELTSANDRVRNSAERIGDGYRHAGNIAREEAKSSTEAWNEAVKASSDKFRAEMKRQGESLSKGIYDYDSYSKADVLSQLKGKGYSDKEAEKLAGSIWSEAMSADRSAKEQGLGKDGSLAVKALINAEYNNAASKGLTTQHGTNKINELMRQMTASNLVSTGPSTKPVDVNALAPNVSTPIASPTTTNASKDVNYNISFGGQTLSLSGSAEQESAMNQLVNQLKVQAKST